MSLFDVVEPDLLLITNDQTDIITKKNVRGAPALVVEITSPSTQRRDRRQKRDLYARAGVRDTGSLTLTPTPSRCSAARLRANSRLRGTLQAAPAIR